MKTSVTKKGQTVIPSFIRHKYGIKDGTSLEWIDTGKTIKVIPVPEDIVKALRGSAKGEKLNQILISERQKDKLIE
ncbi:MAG: AbrB/MazE/SpoVT family DNA-binding domain-containing protein [Acidobacteriota bacterium]